MTLCAFYENVKAVLTSTRNLSFGTKIRKNVYSCFVNLGFKGIHCTNMLTLLNWLTMSASLMESTLLILRSHSTKVG